MSLSIGVVNIEYLHYPGALLYKFMFSLAENPNVGLEGVVSAEDDYWDGYGGFGNSFYEFQKGGLINRANGWATEENLSDSDRSDLIQGIEQLPFREAYGMEIIMLHLSV